MLSRSGSMLSALSRAMITMILGLFWQVMKLEGTRNSCSHFKIFKKLKSLTLSHHITNVDVLTINNLKITSV